MEMQKESEQYPNKVNERRMEDNWSATVVSQRSGPSWNSIGG